MGRQVSVYVRDEEIPLWERAEGHARKHRMAMSALVMAALERYLDDECPPGKRHPER
jgi:hypothetical protein